MSSVDSSEPDLGYFTDVDDWLEYEEVAEPMESYLISGIFYPITIRKILDQRYRTEHNLGHGGFATVWLAHDIRKKRDVALKIMIYGDAGDDELRMQNKIIRTVQDSSNLLTYEDTFFSLRGYMGDHRVLVFPVRGPSLRHCLKQMSIAARMSAAGQLLKALKCLRSGGMCTGLSRPRLVVP